MWKTKGVTLPNVDGGYILQFLQLQIVQIYVQYMCDQKDKFIHIRHDTDKNIVP